MRIRYALAVFVAAILAGCRYDSSCYDLDIICHPWLGLAFYRPLTNPCQYQGGTSRSFYTFLGSAGFGDQARAVCAISDTSILVGGIASGNIPLLQGVTPLNAYTGADDFVIVRLDTAGNVYWYTFVGSAGGTDQLTALTQTLDGGFFAVGSVTANIASLQGKTPLNAYSASTDILAIKFDQFGNVVWYTFLGGPGIETPTSAAVTIDGGLVINGSGDTNIASPGGQTPLNGYNSLTDVLVMKLSSTGALSWYTFFGSAGTDAGTAVASAPDGSLLIAGNASANVATLQGKTPNNAYVGADDYMIIKLSASGAVSWYTFLGGAGTDIPTGVAVMPDLGAAVTGRANAAVASMQGVTPGAAYAGNFDHMVVRLTPAGNVSWFNFIGTAAASDQSGSVAVYSDSSVLVSGFVAASVPSLQGRSPNNPYTAGDDFLLARYTDTGSLTWYTHLGGAGNDQALSGLTPTSDGGFIVSGFSAATIASLQGKTPVNAFAGVSDMVVIKVKPDGNL